MRSRLARALKILTAVLGIAAVALFMVGRSQAPPAPVWAAGMVRQTEIRVAPDITGRLKSITVRPGQHVHRGDVLAILDNPDLAASVGETEAAAASAKADRDNVYAGVRAEEVAIGADDVRSAQANLLLARQENDRVVALSAKDFASRARLDETSASLARAQADVQLKLARYASANAGPTAEERALADAKVKLAAATVANLRSKFDKLTIKAPVDGVVGILVAEPGEILPPGKPILTLDVEGERWFALTLREDQAFGLTLGARATLVTDNGTRIAARVSEMRPLGEFATWRAARAVGDHDLNSFQVRLDPLVPTALAPGMRVWFAVR